MQYLRLIFTIVLLAVLVGGIRRKLDLRGLLLCGTFLCLGCITLLDGSVLDGSCGSVALDCIVYVSTFMSSNLGGIVFEILVVVAYIETISKQGAAEALAYWLKKPLARIKRPYLAAVAVIFAGAFMRTCIGLAPAHAALMSALFFPVLLACGCSIETAAAAMLMPAAISLGPADTNSLSALKLMGLESDMTDFFINIQLPVVAVMLCLLSLFFVLSSRFFDRGYTAEKGDPEALTAKPNVPGCYVVMPLLPMLFLLIFSPLFIHTISIDIVPACLLSLGVSMLLAAASQKSAAPASDMLRTFLSAYGENLKNLGFVVLLAMLFASALNKLGGMRLISGLLIRLSLPGPVLVLAVCLLAAMINTIVGSFFGALSISLPIAAAVADGTGLGSPAVCFLVLISCQVGGLTSPVNPVILTVSERCGISVGALIRRAVFPAWISLAVTALLSTLIF